MISRDKASEWLATHEYTERTCHMDDIRDSVQIVYACSNCEEDIACQFPGTLNYCPNCGAKVVER